MLAYLVIREGSKWTDVFRLVPGQSVTIGRAPTNQIVVKDERCSRCHAEIFFSEDQWTLRDLDSRNGTMIGQHPRARRLPAASRRHHSHRPLAIALRPRSVEGVHRKQWPDRRRPPTCSTTRRQRAAGGRRLERAGDPRADDDHASPRADEVSRAARGRRDGVAEDGPRRGQLVPAGLRAGQGADVVTMADLALAGLFEGTQVDAGAVLLLPRHYRGRAERERPGDRRLAQRLDRCPTIACRTFWPRPCCARARPCWPAT